MGATTSFRVIGIDPGSRITGFGIVEKKDRRLRHVDNGCLSAPRTDSLPSRLAQIYEALLKTIDAYRPDAFAVEQAFFHKNVASAMKLGESRGIAILAAVQKGLPIYEYAPRAIKQAVVGYGDASKEQIQKMVVRLLGLKEAAAEDASDALAVAICHLNTNHRLEGTGEF